MGGDGRPSMRDAHFRISQGDHAGFFKTVVQPHEGLPVSVVPLNGNIHGIKGIVVAPFFVFCLVVEHAPFDFDLSGREIALEIFHVGRGVPQGPFHKGKELNGFYLSGKICECQFLHFAPGLQGDQEQHPGGDAVFGPFYSGVIHTVTAFIMVEGRFHGFPSR